MISARRAFGPLDLRRLHLPIIAGVLLSTSACEGGAVDEQRSSDGRQTSIPLEVVSEATIGGSEARGPAALGRVANAQLLENPTRVAVSEASAREIRIFSAEGEYVETIGREGSGPGEYEDLSSVFRLHGGGVVGWDSLRRMMIIHGDAGEESMRLDLPALSDRVPRFLGVFPDTTFAFSFPLTTRDMTRPTGRLVDTVPFLRLDRGGAVIDTIALVEAPEREFFESGPMRGLEEDILGDELRAVVAGDEMVLTRDREVRHYPASGPPRAYQVDWDPLAPTADMVRAERQRRIDDSRAPRVQLSSGEDLGALHTAVIERLPAADTVPAFDGLATGYDSSIWVRRFALPNDTVSHWYLLDREGGTRANLRLPVDERVESGTAEHVVVSGRDTLGAVVLRILELESMP